MAPVTPATSPADVGPIAPPPETMKADTPRTTVDGNTFIAPAGWKVEVRGQATILTPPESDSHIALVDVAAADGDAARDAAWKIYKADASWPLLNTTERPDRDGWSKQKGYNYRTSPNEKRSVGVGVAFANNRWLVSIYDMADATGEKRAGQVSLVFGRLLPKGFTRESFAGKTAAKIDAPRLADLQKYVQEAMKATGVPAVSVGIIQDGKVVWSGGYGPRELGKKEQVDGKTLFMVASNTKSLTTLMLAKLVDEKKAAWDQPVTALWPSFKLGSDEVTRQVQVKHLICACTGMPRQDMEWLLEWKGSTPESVMKSLAGMQPTSKFGELFQYSNVMAAAGGYTGGHVLYPKMEIGAAYDKAMQEKVFGPLGMTSTTFDYARALRGNHAMPHAPDIDDKPARALMEENYSIISARPAGAAWSSVDDLLKYVAMELAEGKLPDGKPYIGKEALLARREAQVAIGKDRSYGMGLFNSTKWDAPMVHHGGDMIGFHSDMLWIPAANTGAVILTNGDPGWLIRSAFARKLLEVLYAGRPEADADVASAAKRFFDNRAAARKLLTVPADAAAAAKLAKRYKSEALGEIAVTVDKGKTTFDFGEFKSEVATKKNPDGTTSFATIVPGFDEFEVVVAESAGKRTLIMRDAQHEYVFTEQ
jgi:CubicO group peptidase (beta-lactamase class C family)